MTEQLTPEEQRPVLKDGEHGIPSVQEIVDDYEKGNSADDHEVGCQGVALYTKAQLEKLSDVCPECKGNKTIPMRYSRFSQDRETTCPTCKGTGRNDEKLRGTEIIEWLGLHSLLTNMNEDRELVYQFKAEEWRKFLNEKGL